MVERIQIMKVSFHQPAKKQLIDQKTFDKYMNQAYMDGFNRGQVMGSRIVGTILFIVGIVIGYTFG